MKGPFRLLPLLLLPIASFAQGPNGLQDKTGSRCKLSFEYLSAPNRPVDFMARVINRDKDKNFVKEQKCAEVVEYDRGNYHVTINTFPPIERNLDMDYDESVVTIPQPGSVKFVCGENAITAILSKQVGDKFQAFDTLNFKDATPLRINIQPGIYEIRHRELRNPPGPWKMAAFKITSNNEQPVDLK